MDFSKRIRALVIGGGALLLLIGLAVWLLPVLISHDAVVRERVQMREGTVTNTTIKQPFGWADLQWEPVAIVLLGLGGSIFVLGVLPPNSIKGFRTGVVDIHLREKEVESALEGTAKLAPRENFAQVGTEALKDLSNQRARGFSQKQIDRTISRIIEEEADENDDS
jgi:hypothetical protein